MDIEKLNKLREKVKNKINVNWKLDNFNIGKKLGHGSFGDIYLCKEKNNQDKYSYFALKCIFFKQSTEQQIVREIENLSNLKHPNITELFGMFFEYDRIYMILEYCEFGDLFEIIQNNGPLSEQQMSRYTSDIAKALQFCNEKNVYHRDIKPENILIGKGNVAKLCDFGFSIYIAEGMLALRKSSYGTTDYVAPEVLNNKYDGRIDIWSFGTVIYEAVHGSPPFYDESYSKTFKNIETCNIIYPSNFSTSLVDMLKKMIVLLPEFRITAADILKHDWIVKHERK